MCILPHLATEPFYKRRKQQIPKYLRKFFKFQTEDLNSCTVILLPRGERWRSQKRYKMTQDAFLTRFPLLYLSRSQVFALKIPSPKVMCFDTFTETALAYSAVHAFPSLGCMVSPGPVYILNEGLEGRKG